MEEVAALTMPRAETLPGWRPMGICPEALSTQDSPSPRVLARRDRALATPRGVAPAPGRVGLGGRNCLQRACGFLGGPRSSSASLKLLFVWTPSSERFWSATQFQLRLAGAPTEQALAAAVGGRPAPMECGSLGLAIRSDACHLCVTLTCVPVCRVCPRSRRSPLSHGGGACLRSDSPLHACADGHGQRGWGTGGPMLRDESSLPSGLFVHTDVALCLPFLLSLGKSGFRGPGSRITLPGLGSQRGGGRGALLVGSNARYNVGLLFVP